MLSPQKLEDVDLAALVSRRLYHVQQWLQPCQHLLYVGQALLYGWHRLGLGSHWRYYSPVHT